ncbi:MAG: FAD-dependent oxidoreductase [Halobacteriales archaeon]
MSESVAVLGGGVAGLSAAKELVERGFDVSVREKRGRFGGKARSVPVPDTGGSGSKPLPGEHGFRFFPAFYRHLFDTMKGIPYGDNEDGVHGNLVPVNEWIVAREGQSEVDLPIELPDMIEEWETVLDFLVGTPLDVPEAEKKFFVDRLLTFLTSCEERRREEYEHIPWWEFIDAENKSWEYQQVYGIGLTRCLVAMKAKESSTRTIGKIYTQLLFGIAMPWLSADKILNGPTNEVWIDPWVEYLDAEGVEFYPESTVEHIECVDGRITGVDIRRDGEIQTVTADQYLAALPVEVMEELVTAEIAEAAPSLGEIDQLKTEWMNGIQYYLGEDVTIADGHAIYQGSPWALTSVSQRQFWESDLSEYGEADVEGIISICISDWEAPGELIEKPAKECTPQEVKDEVWHQLTTRLDNEASEGLTEDLVLDWHLDPAIEYPAPNEATNAEPLLVNTVGSLQYRPEADTGIPNLFLAADYVRTNSDLACMEGANEAARRAVNGILDAIDSDAERCTVWDVEDPAVFKPMKMYDRMRYDMGKSHRDA